MDAVATGTHIQFSHDAACPKISPVHCAEGEIIPHQHHQTVLLTRLQPTLSIGLGKGWQTMLRTPVDMKVMGIEYTDTDGNPFDPPYGNIHHRNETLTGLGDAELEVQYFAGIDDKWVVGGGMGSMLPFGRTEENPYILASQSLEHQHMQMGGGTFDPILSGTVVHSGHRWGLTAHGKGRLALSENSKRYRSSPYVQVGVGPTYRFTTKTMLTTEVRGQKDWQAEWDGEPDRMSGRTLFTVGSSIIHRFTPQLAVMGQLQVTALQWSVEDIILQRFIGSMGVSMTPAKKNE